MKKKVRKKEGKKKKGKSVLRRLHAGRVILARRQTQNVKTKVSGLWFIVLNPFLLNCFLCFMSKKENIFISFVLQSRESVAKVICFLNLDTTTVTQASGRRQCRTEEGEIGRLSLFQQRARDSINRLPVRPSIGFCQVLGRPMSCRTHG